MENNENILEIKDLREAEPLEIAEHIVKVLDSKKARGLQMLHVEGQSSITDYLVLCSGTSNTQIKSLAGEVEYQLTLCGQQPIHTDGYNEGTWVVLDFGCVMVHVFSRDSRDFYKLEKIYGPTCEIDISNLITD